MAGARLIELSSLMKRDHFVGHWHTLSQRFPLFAFPEDIRKVIYTTNAIESVNMTLREVSRNHRIFPSDEVVYKVLYLAIQNSAVARGRCPSATGNRRSIALLWNSQNGFQDDSMLFNVSSV